MDESGDTCQAMASTSEISLSDFYAWNPAVGSGCTSLITGDYVCHDYRVYGYHFNYVSHYNFWKWDAYSISYPEWHG